MKPDKIKALALFIIALSVTLLICVFVVSWVFPTLFPTQNVTQKYNGCIQQFNVKLNTLQKPNETSSQFLSDDYEILRKATNDLMFCLNEIFTNKVILTQDSD